MVNGSRAWGRAWISVPYLSDQITQVQHSLPHLIPLPCHMHVFISWRHCSSAQCKRVNSQRPETAMGLADSKLPAHPQIRSLRVSAFLFVPAHQDPVQHFWLWACCPAGSIVLFIIGEDFLRRFIKYWTRGLLSIWCHRIQSKQRISRLIWLLVVWKHVIEYISLAFMGEW